MTVRQGVHRVGGGLTYGEGPRWRRQPVLRYARRCRAPSTSTVCTASAQPTHPGHRLDADDDLLVTSWHAVLTG
jgi:hypothetical protein